MKHLKISLVLFSFISLISFGYHPYHVGSWEINYNNKSKSLEITGKFFSEDMEKVLQTEYGKKIDLKSTLSKEENNTLLGDYCENHLSIQSNNKKIGFQWIGYETKSESIFMYLETPKIKTPKKLEITTSMLYKEIQEQIIFVHIMINSKRQSQKIANPENKVIKNF